MRRVAAHVEEAERRRRRQDVERRHPAVAQQQGRRVPAADDLRVVIAVRDRDELRGDELLAVRVLGDKRVQPRRDDLQRVRAAAILRKARVTSAAVCAARGSCPITSPMSRRTPCGATTAQAMSPPAGLPWGSQPFAVAGRVAHEKAQCMCPPEVRGGSRKGSAVTLRQPLLRPERKQRRSARVFSERAVYGR